MAQFKQWFEQDFTEKIEIRHCESVMFTGDDNGAIVGVYLYDNGTPYSGGGGVAGAVKRLDGGLVALTGTLSGNAASVVIPAAALAFPGPIGVHVVLTQGGQTTTILKAIYSVDDNTGTPVDPGTVVPSLEELMGEIAAMRATTAAAAAAAASATAAVSQMDARFEQYDQQKVNKPETNPNGTEGQVLRTNGDGSTTWVTQGLPTDEQTAEAVNTWLDDHPEATTTVQDGSITAQKLAPGVLETVTPEMYGAKGDGQTDDTQPIQTALNTGKHVIFTRGHTYVISSALVAPASTRIHGNGAKLLMSADSPITQAWDQGAYIDANAGVILTASFVYDMQIDGGDHKWQAGIHVADTSQNAEVLRCKVVNIENDTYQVYGILINDGADYGTSCRVAYCEIANLSSPSNGVVSDAKGTCVGISGYCYKALTIEYNTIHAIHAPVPSGASYSPDDAYGIYVAYKNSKRINALVRGNLIYSVDNTGIKWHNPGTIVEGNQINMDALATGDVKMGYGIRFYGADSVVRENHISYSGSAAMYGLFAEAQTADNTIIEGNVFDCPQCTIVLDVRSKNNTIRKNTLVSATESTSLYVFSVAGSNNVVDDNQISGAWAVSVNGTNQVFQNNKITGKVQLSYTKAAYIANNIIDGGILVTNANTANPGTKIINNDFKFFAANQKMYDVEINGNTIREESAGEDAVAFAAGVDSLIFQHNIISGQNKGLAAGNSTKLSIIGNIIANASTPINISSSAGAILVGNLYKNGAAAITTGVTGLVNENNGNMPA